LFAGSGALGLEALSRGAATCVFVERQRAASRVIADNLGRTRLGGGRVVNAPVDGFLKRDAALYDVVFADPPYWRQPGDHDDLKELLGSSLLAGRVADGGWLVAEASSHYQTPASAHFTLHDRRTYGSSALLFFKKPAADD
jgi:16S rRNA (guanine966-N2)-methyltransferase